ncbi:MAG: hypothetical protein ACE5JC_03090 [Candidatus Zixiibacteriota bacterium]
MRRKISFVAALSVLLVFSLNAAGRCGLERMVNFRITLPLEEFAEKDKGLALTSGCLGAGLLYDLSGGVALCGNFNYRHFGADLLSDSLGGSWQVLSLTGGLRLIRGKVGPYIPYLELGGELPAGSRSLNADAGSVFVLRAQFWAVRRHGVEEWKSRWGGV